MKYIYLFLFVGLLGYGCEKDNLDKTTEKEFPFSPEEIEIEENIISISIKGMEDIILTGSAYLGKDGVCVIASDDVYVQFYQCKIHGASGGGTVGGPPQFYFKYTSDGLNSGTVTRGLLDLDLNGIPSILWTLNGPDDCPQIEDKLELLETDSTIIGLYIDDFHYWNGMDYDCETRENVEELIIQFNLRKAKC